MRSGMQPGALLSNVASEMYERRWERYKVNCPAAIIAVRVGLVGTITRYVTLLDISRGGAGLEMNPALDIGPHYYLEILGLGKRIGCAEVFRSGWRAGASFIEPISEKMLNQILQCQGPSARPDRSKASGWRAIKRL